MCGQRCWAWRRRCPITTPSSAAAGVRATTRCARMTAAGTSGRQPAATTGQSGHHTVTIRIGSSPDSSPDPPRFVAAHHTASGRSFRSVTATVSPIVPSSHRAGHLGQELGLRIAEHRRIAVACRAELETCSLADQFDRTGPPTRHPTTADLHVDHAADGDDPCRRPIPPTPCAASPTRCRRRAHPARRGSRRRHPSAAIAEPSLRTAAGTSVVTQSGGHPGQDRDRIRRPRHPARRSSRARLPDARSAPVSMRTTRSSGTPNSAAASVPNVDTSTTAIQPPSTSASRTSPNARDRAAAPRHDTT